MSFGANIYTSQGDLVFSDSWSSIVHIATVGPRNYGGMAPPAGMVDFELPDDCPDDVIPFVRYTGSSPSAVVPVIIGVFNQGHNYCALFSNFNNQKFLIPTPAFGFPGGVMFWGLRIARGLTNASQSSTLTLTFSSPWTTHGFPSTVVIPNIPPNTNSFALADLIGKKFKELANVSTAVLFSEFIGTTFPTTLYILPNETMGTLIGFSVPPTPGVSWSAAPAYGLTFTASIGSRGRFNNASSHVLIPQIGDIIQYNGSEYTVTAMSGNPSVTSTTEINVFSGATITTSPALPATTVNTQYRIKRVKRFVRVWTGNASSEIQNHRVYLFGRIRPPTGGGHGMRIYNSSGDITFDSQQRMLILSGRGITPQGTLNYADSNSELLTINLQEGTIPSQYAVNTVFLGSGATQYGANPTGSPNLTRACNLHLRRINATQMGVYWANQYPFPTIVNNSPGTARPRWNVPFYIIDTSKYPSA